VLVRPLAILYLALRLHRRRSVVAKMPKMPMLNPAHKGRLKKALGVPASEPIPAPKLAKALTSPSPKIRKMANFAKVSKTWAHPGDNDPLPTMHTSKHH